MEFYIDDRHCYRASVSLARLLSLVVKYKIQEDDIYIILEKYFSRIIAVFDNVYKENLTGVDEIKLYNVLFFPIQRDIGNELADIYTKRKQGFLKDVQMVLSITRLELSRTFPIMYRLQKTRPEKIP